MNEMMNQPQQHIVREGGRASLPFNPEAEGYVQLNDLVELGDFVLAHAGVEISDESWNVFLSDQQQKVARQEYMQSWHDWQTQVAHINEQQLFAARMQENQDEEKAAKKKKAA